MEALLDYLLDRALSWSLVIGPWGNGLIICDLPSAKRAGLQCRNQNAPRVVHGLELVDKSSRMMSVSRG